MKTFITNSMEHYSNIFPKPIYVVSHMFAVLGNGVALNLKGYLPSNYQGEEAFIFDSPVPFDWIYPWSDTECFQPFRDLAGCRDVGFKETAQYFIDCVECTPDSVENIKEWKNNLHLVKQVLLETPAITDDFESTDDIDKFLDEIKTQGVTSNAPMDGTKLESKSSVYKKWFFDVQWSDTPNCVEEEVRQSWQDRELGNDKYFWTATVNEELFKEYPRIYFWLIHKGVPLGDEVIVHWWW